MSESSQTSGRSPISCFCSAAWSLASRRSAPASCRAGRRVCSPSGSGWPPRLRCFRTSSSGSWQCRSAWGWPCWGMRSGLTGASMPRTSSLAGTSRSSAQLQPSKLAGDRMDRTSGHVAACLTKYTLVTEIMTADGDADSPRGPVPSKRAVQRTPHGVHPSKELSMNVHVADEGRVPAVGRRDQGGQPPSRNPKVPAKAASARWLIAGLLVLSAIPLINGAFRLTQLAGGAAVTPTNARFFASPVPVVVHIVSAAVYAILGAFQFANGFRRRWPGWHHWAGRLLVVCGLLVGLSGLWMTLFYPWPAGDGAL